MAPGEAAIVCLVGPARTGKSHVLVALGDAAVDSGHRVRYLTAAELVETLYNGLADNSVGRVIERLLRADGESYRMREARARGGVTRPKKR